MSTHLEIDLMIPQLEEMLPEWAAFYPEQQFMRMLAAALDYIAASADPEARLYCVMRTGHLHLCSGEIPWPAGHGGPGRLLRVCLRPSREILFHFSDAGPRVLAASFELCRHILDREPVGALEF